MKIELELPDWAKGTITIHNDMELVAYQIPGKRMKVKKTRCTNCGECCLNVPDGHFSWGIDEEGKCDRLEKQGDKWVCTAGREKPFNCCTVVSEENCDIEWEEL